MKPPESAADDANASVENRWCLLRDAVQTTAQAVVGRSRRQHQDWFDDNDADPNNLLAEKNRLHYAYINRPTDDNKAAFYQMGRTLQKRPRPPSIISDAAIARLPQVETNSDLDLPPPLHETIWAMHQLSSGKAPGLKAVPAEIYKHVTLEQEFLPESQCSFSHHRGTTDMTFTAGQLQEKCHEMRTHLYSTFVGLTKAFDTVNREGLWKIMHKFGCPERFTQILRQLHDGMPTRVTENGAVSEAFALTNEVKQSCVLAPTVFSLVFSAMLMDAYRDEGPGIRVAYRTDGHLPNQWLIRQQQPQSVDSNGDRVSRKFYSLPYMPRISEAIARQLNQFGISIAHKPASSLRTTLSRVKDPIPKEQQTNVIYRIPCANCSSVYVGHTGRRLGTRINEHKLAIRRRDPLSLVFAHAIECDHRFNWEGTEVIASANTKQAREFLEAWHSNDNSINRHVDLDAHYEGLRSRFAGLRPP
ncbi:hypothetical protein SprV_0100415100 [Sparganum proliferum]